MVVHRNTFEDLLQTVLADYQPSTDLVHQPPTSIEPRRYLLDAYNEISTSTKTHLKLQLPCGTSKSYIMLYTMLEYLKQDAHTPSACSVPGWMSPNNCVICLKRI